MGRLLFSLICSSSKAATVPKPTIGTKHPPKQDRLWRCAVDGTRARDRLSCVWPGCGRLPHLQIRDKGRQVVVAHCGVMTAREPLTLWQEFPGVRANVLDSDPPTVARGGQSGMRQTQKNADEKLTAFSRKLFTLLSH
jgi:hypothetical protein